MEIRELISLLDYAEKLSDGIDPTSNIAFSEDTILNSPKVKQYNRRVATVLKELLKADKKACTFNGKILFNMSQNEKNTFNFTDGCKSISSLVYQMNGYCKAYMKKLRAIDITKWMESKGYLESKRTESGMTFKVATVKGNKLGIVTYKKKNKFGNEYSVNMYNDEAQKYIVNNIEKIING